MPTAYGDLALEALRAYALRGPQLTFLGHNDTITYPVETGGAQYLLRLHMPMSEAFAGERQSLRAIASELLWLEALRHETDLTLQRPVPSLIGWLVIEVEAERARVDAASGLCASDLRRRFLSVSDYRVRRAAAEGVIFTEDLAVIERAHGRVLEEIASIEDDSDSRTLIHADLHRGNLLFHRCEVRAIDFSLCGYGSHMQGLDIPMDGLIIP
jgi:hypothetical protein